ncbi:hypothetical protein RMSM_07330 [Rhodopirellula maiorica SM1]|uniref:Uncharacterized protein n=1 Tax=Rhodopirellula maiorica SM1 TaxID=1265738 RepID=M5RP74_9BACT|nr:hypothetical protein RMSM_07330 [Rhodopirellula maiorica SM1]
MQLHSRDRCGVCVEQNHGTLFASVTANDAASDRNVFMTNLRQREKI